MPEFISLEIKGLDKLVKAFDKWPREIQLGILQAGREASNEILNTEGLRGYPPSTAANRPPAPYYIRGRGTQYASGRNRGESENLGKQWVRTRSGSYGIRISNRASYAWAVHGHKAGKKQARAMGRIGWRKLFDVAKEKIPEITRIYQRWVNRTIKRLGL